MKTASPFSDTTYTRLFFAQATSLVGTGITTVALALLAWELAGISAGKVLGVALALKMVAYVFLSPVFAGISHKVPKRLWLIMMDMARAVLILFLPFIQSIWQIYVILFLVNTFSAGFTPVFQSVIPDILKDERQYQKALSYSRLLYNLEQLASPAIAAFLLTIMRFNHLFYLDAVTFVVSAILVAACVLPVSKQADRPDRMLDHLLFGVSSYLRTPRLKAVFVMYFAVASASAMVIINTVIYVKDYLGLGETQTAIALGVSGAGSMAAAILLPSWLQKWKMKNILLFGTFLLWAGLLSGMFRPQWGGFLALWFVLGVGLAIVQTPVGFIIRISCNESDSLAFFAANFSLSHFCWFGAYLLAGYLSSNLGLSFAFFISGFIALTSFFLARKIYPDPDITELDHIHEGVYHRHRHAHDAHHEHLHTAETDHEGDHEHWHRHNAIRHRHRFVIDYHHRTWPGFIGHRHMD